MRIVSGEYGGRRFTPPAKIPARPTTDLAKEGLFNVLTNMLDLEECSVLELFAGTGNIAYEFASRGVPQMTLVEKDKVCVQFIKDTFKTLKYEGALVIQGDALRYITTCPQSYDIVFADPPYLMPEMDKIPDMVLASNLLNEDGWFILEHTHNVFFEAHPHFVKSKNYGGTHFSFFQKK